MTAERQPVDGTEEELQPLLTGRLVTSAALPLTEGLECHFSRRFERSDPCSGVGSLNREVQGVPWLARTFPVHRQLDQVSELRFRAEVRFEGLGCGAVEGFGFER